MNNQIFRIIKKFNKILSKQQKKRSIQLVFLMLFGGFLETFSVSMIYPFIELVMRPDEFMDRTRVQQTCNLLGISDVRGLLLLLAITLALLYLLKNAYLLAEYNIQYRFVYSNMLLVQKKLLSGFINRPYEFFLNANSGELIRIIHSDTSSAFGLLITLLNFFTELIVSVMLIMAVFVVAPAATLIIGIVLMVLLSFINFFLRPVLGKCGKLYQKSSSGMYKWLLQSIEGIKELKVMNKETFFEAKYDECGQQYVKALRKSNILTVVPKFIIEAFCLSTMFVVVAWLIYRGTSLDKIVPILSTVSLAALRLLPSVNRISGSLNSMSYNEPMLDGLIHCIEENTINSIASDSALEKSQSNKAMFLDKISFAGVKYKYPNTEKNILDGADLEIKKGESIGIIGASGAGKTTTVDILLGLLSPYEGQILIDGIAQNNSTGFLKMIGYIPQSIFILDDSIKANVAFGENEICEEKVIAAIKDASLYDYVSNLPDGIETQIGERGIRLSGGQRQRIGIARALYHNPDILIFDEATSSLDVETERSIIDSINFLMGQKTLIIIAHRLSTIEKCNHVYRVEDGKIIQER